MLTLIFLYTEETDLSKPVRTIYSRDLIALTEREKPLNVVDRSETVAKTSASTSPQRPSLWYIYFYTKEAEDMTCSEANNYCGLCTDHLFFSFFLVQIT